MRVRIKFFCFCLLLCLAVGCLLFSAVETIQAYQKVQQSHQRILSGDVNSIDAWMTFPYIARVYRIPEGCLYQSLHFPNTWMVRHSTLRVIADHYARPLQTVIQDVRQVILRYRKNHTICGTPAPTALTTGFIQRSPLATRKGELDE